MNNHEQLKSLFLEKINDLTKREREMIRHIVQRSHTTRNTNKEFDEQLTFGQRMADRVASFGGSWTFHHDLHICPARLDLSKFIHSRET